MSQEQIYLKKIRLNGELDNTVWQKIEEGLRALPKVIKVDVNRGKNVVRLISEHEITTEVLHKFFVEFNLNFEVLKNEVPVLAPSQPSHQVVEVQIQGMHCRSCELTVERCWRELPGVHKVSVNSSTGRAKLICSGTELSVNELQQHLGDNEYKVLHINKQSNQADKVSNRPSFWKLVGLFVIVLLVGRFLSRLGFLSPAVGAINSTSLMAVFILGLVAASSSCLAVAGGLMLSTIGTFRAKYENASKLRQLQPVLLFIAGRIAGYTLLGAAIGLVGKVLTPAPWVTGLITLLAAIFMLTMGLEMLNLAPQWLKRIVPRLPKNIGHKLMDAQGKPQWYVPFLLGGGTFFLPCGFTQALQLYALTTGSALTSGIILGVFALGTAPALLALGFVSGSLKGKLGDWFFSLAGATVLVLGLWNIQNGLTVLGYPIKLSALWPTSQADSTQDSNVTFNGREQVMKMKVFTGGYAPDSFTLQAGVPVRWEIDARGAQGCVTVLQAPRLGVKPVFLKPTADNVVTFTPEAPGSYTFSCGMGMYRGQIVVVAKS